MKLAPTLAIFAVSILVACTNSAAHITPDPQPGEGILLETGTNTPRRTPEILSISTWNVGYAGLGWDSDFTSDGGTHLFAPSAAAVDRNLTNITAVSKLLQTDVMFFQEVAKDSPLTFWRDVAGSLRQALSPRIFWFQPEISPQALRARHGKAIATDLNQSGARVIPIIGEAKPMFGLIKRQYSLQVLRLPASDGRGDWLLINIHLSAFDDGGALRRAQIDAVFDYAQTQFQLGRRVVIGGDWNMELTANTFPHNTDSEFLFWIHPFATEQLPQNWQIAIDPALPTVRTLHQPYVEDDNYVTIIDGFITSPNVEIVSVAGVDTTFHMSDHMPVIGRFRALN